MRPAMSHLSETDALFVSALQRSDEPSARQVRQAVAAALRQYGGQGCAGRVAEEFGEHPETAAARMQWARGLIAEQLGESRLRKSRERPRAQHSARRAA